MLFGYFSFSRMMGVDCGSDGEDLIPTFETFGHVVDLVFPRGWGARMEPNGFVSRLLACFVFKSG